MARQGKGIFDVPRGSLSNVTGYKSKGKSIIKTKNKNTPKTKTPAMLEAQSNFRLSMRIYHAIMNSPWAPYLNYSLPGKSFMNNILSLSNVFNAKEDMIIHDINLFGKKDYHSKARIWFFELGNWKLLRLYQWNTPLTPDAKSDDRYFFITYEKATDIITVQPNLEHYRGIGDMYTAGKGLEKHIPNTFVMISCFFSFDFTKIFQQHCIVGYIP